MTQYISPESVLPEGDIQPQVVVFRLDANLFIGSGHAMRCRSVALALSRYGARSIFAVSDDESRAFVESAGCEACVIGGDSLRLGRADGETLGKFAQGMHAAAVFVDTYAITEEFFRELALCDIPIAYLDDQYTFERGLTQNPTAWPVDLVVNYSFYADTAAYKAAYGDAARFLMGPRFAFIGENFIGKSARAGSLVADVLITTGSTNPDNTLERMTRGCLRGCSARLHVVVGAKSAYNLSAVDPSMPERERIIIHHAVHDMPSLMEGCDLAVSAAGTTTYELCYMGLPTIATPIVDNQRRNAESFAERGLGLAIDRNASADEIAHVVQRFSGDVGLRAQMSERMRATVDGAGSRLIAPSLLALR